MAAIAIYFMNRYKVFFDPGMIRNILHTDLKEASELLVPGLLAHVAVYGLLPSLILWRVKLTKRSWQRAILGRAVFLVGAAIILVCGIALVFQDLSALLRNQKGLRYLIPPGN